MTGKILDYSIQNGEGIISADDGERYSFQVSQWKTNDAHPAKNMQVDFAINDTEATEIYALNEITTKYSNTTVVQNQETSVGAIISLIFGIAGLFASWWLFAIPSIVAIITGHFARSVIKNSNGRLGGDGLAVTGLVLGYLVILFYIVVVVFIIGILGLATMKY